MGICRSTPINHQPFKKHNKSMNPLESPTSDNGASLQHRICVTNAFSPIGMAIISALEKNFPQHYVRAGIAHEHIATKQFDMDVTLPKQVDVVAMNPSKRQSLIWSFVGIESLLLVPSHDPRLHTTLSYIAAAKAAGVKLITVVSCPTRNADGVLSYSNTPDAVERAVLKSKLGCCFVRLPFVLETQPLNNGKYNASIPLSACVMSGVGGHESPSASRVASISLVDVGCACASILANYKQHMFTRYDLFIRPDGDPSEDSIQGPARSSDKTYRNSPFPLPTSPDVGPVLASDTDSSGPSPLASAPSSATSAGSLGSLGSSSGSNSEGDSHLSSSSSSEAGSVPNSAPGSPTNHMKCEAPPSTCPSPDLSPVHVQPATCVC